MKNFIVPVFLIGLSLNSAIAVATPAPSAIKLCYEDVSVFPWITGDETGLVFTELKQIEKKLNIKFTYIRLPWKRCQFEGQSGNVDGLIAASFTKERTNWGVYPTDEAGELNRQLRFHTDSFYVYTRKDSAIKFRNGKFENLGNNQIGVQLGYSVGTHLKDAGYAIHSSFSTAYDLLKELDYSALEVAVLQDHESTKILNENPKFKKHVVRLTPPYKVADQYLLFSKIFFNKYPEVSKAIWNAIPEARKSEQYSKQEQKLLAK